MTLQKPPGREKVLSGAVPCPVLCSDCTGSARDGSAGKEPRSSPRTERPSLAGLPQARGGGGVGEGEGGGTQH